MSLSIAKGLMATLVYLGVLCVVITICACACACVCMCVSALFLLRAVFLSPPSC